MAKNAPPEVEDRQRSFDEDYTSVREAAVASENALALDDFAGVPHLQFSFTPEEIPYLSSYTERVGIETLRELNRAVNEIGTAATRPTRPAGLEQGSGDPEMDEIKRNVAAQQQAEALGGEILIQGFNAIMSPLVGWARANGITVNEAAVKMGADPATAEILGTAAEFGTYFIPIGGSLSGISKLGKTAKTEVGATERLLHGAQGRPIGTTGQMARELSEAERLQQMGLAETIDAARAATGVGQITQLNLPFPEDTPAVMNRLRKLMTKDYPAAVERARRHRPRPQEQVIAESTQSGVDVEFVKALAQQAGVPLRDEQAAGMAFVLDEFAQKRVIPAAQKLLGKPTIEERIATLEAQNQALRAGTKPRLTSADEKDIRDFLGFYSELMQMHPAWLGTRAETGGALKIMDEPIKGISDFIRNFATSAADLAAGAVNILGTSPRLRAGYARYGIDVTKLKADLNAGAVTRDVEVAGALRLAMMVTDLAKVRGGVEKMAMASRGLMGTVKNWLVFAYLNGLLTNPTTHVVNFLSNASTALVIGPAERTMAAAIGLAFRLTGRPAGVSLVEAGGLYVGIIRSLREALRRAAHTMRTGERSVVQFDKIEGRAVAGMSSESLEAGGILARGLDAIHTILPTRLLATADEFWQYANLKAGMTAEAMGDLSLGGFKGRALWEKTEELVGQMQPSRVKSGIDYAAYQTFTGAPGPIMEAISKGRQVIDDVFRIPVGTAILPFVNTPGHLANYFRERTPILNLASVKMWKDLIGSRGPRARDLAYAKLGTSVILGTLVSEYTVAGRISGRGPTEPELRAAMRALGWRPYSVFINGKWISYSRADPTGMVIGMIADYVEIAGFVDEETRQDLGTALMVALSTVASGETPRGMARIMLNKTWLEGLSNAFDLLDENDALAERAWIRLFSGLPPAIPAVRLVERIGDPAIREYTNVFENQVSGIPGWSEGLPARRDYFTGDVAVTDPTLGPQWLSPFRLSKRKYIPWIESVLNNQILLHPPMRKMDGVELTQKEKNDYIQLYAKRVQFPASLVGGKGNRLLDMQAAMNQLVKSPVYEAATTGPDGSKAELIGIMWNLYRAQAQAIMKSGALPEFADFSQRWRAQATAEQAARIINLGQEAQVLPIQ